MSDYIVPIKMYNKFTRKSHRTPGVDMLNTENLIVNAFLALIDEKPLKSITVRDITDRCHINRNTFYYHYSSISNLVGEIMRRQFDALLFRGSVPAEPEEYLVLLAQCLLKDKKTILHIYRSLSEETMKREFPMAVNYAVSQYLKLSGQAERPDSEAFIALYSSALTGILFSWLEAGLPQELEQKAHQMIALIRK